VKPIQRGEILDIAEYEKIREPFRARVISEKKLRRVAVGDKATALFENRDTVLLQIQEMIRTERITREAGILHEIETYNKLVPGENELSCTVMIEIPEAAERDKFLALAHGFERHVAILVGGETVRATWEKERELPDRASAVNYLKFPLSERSAGTLRTAARGDVTVTRVELIVDHPAYGARVSLPVDTIVSLGEDLAG
jgi:hypothetical protein